MSTTGVLLSALGIEVVAAVVVPAVVLVFFPSATEDREDEQ